MYISRSNLSSAALEPKHRKLMTFMILPGHMNSPVGNTKKCHYKWYFRLINFNNGSRRLRLEILYFGFRYLITKIIFNINIVSLAYSNCKHFVHTEVLRFFFFIENVWFLQLCSEFMFKTRKIAG